MRRANYSSDLTKCKQYPSLIRFQVGGAYKTTIQLLSKTTHKSSCGPQVLFTADADEHFTQQDIAPLLPVEDDKNTHLTNSGLALVEINMKTKSNTLRNAISISVFNPRSKLWRQQIRKYLFERNEWWTYFRKKLAFIIHLNAGYLTAMSLSGQPDRRAFIEVALGERSLSISPADALCIIQMIQ